MVLTGQQDLCAVFSTFTTTSSLWGLGAFCDFMYPHLSHLSNGLITKDLVWAQKSS